MNRGLTPKRIVEELNKYIISQDEAKKNVAISLRNRDRRKSIEDEELRKEITPKNIILMGPTGVGKTEIARRIAKIADAPFLKVEATKYTEVGYVGKDVESIIKDLTSLTYRKMKEQKFNELREEAYETALEKAAKLVKPYDSLNDEEKAQIMQDIDEGKYDDTEVEIEKTRKDLDLPIIEVVSGNDDTSGIGSILDQVMAGVSGKSKKMITTVKNAIGIMIDEEVEKKLDLDSLNEEVIENVENNGIIFIDEIDKIAERDGVGKGEVSRQGVQRDILPIVEGSTVMTKFGPVKTDHILFIAAGAFTQSSPSDLMPELQGRFPIRVKLKNLEREDFVKILTDVEYNLLDQYTAMLATDNVELSFTKGAIEKIADITAVMNEKVENIGARRLSAVVEELLREVMYEAPYEKKKKVSIDANFVKKIFKKENEEEKVLPDFIKGESGPHEPSLTEKWTQPPKLYTEATLLRAMETAGKLVDDDELRDALKENGIGRPSTRAAIIETLFKRNYIRKERKNLIPTSTGIELIQTIQDELLKSAELTGIWENKLRKIERSEYNARNFLDELKIMVTQIVNHVRNDSVNRSITIQDTEKIETNKAKKTDTKKKSKNANPAKKEIKNQRLESEINEIICPICKQGKILKGKSAYGCSNWKNGCTFRINFSDCPPDISTEELQKVVEKYNTERNEE